MKILQLTVVFVFVGVVNSYAFIGSVISGVNKVYDKTAGRAYEEIMKAQAIQQTQTLFQNYRDSKKFYDDMYELQKKEGIGQHMTDSITDNIRQTNEALYQDFQTDIRTAPQDRRHIDNILNETEALIGRTADTAADRSAQKVGLKVARFRDNVDFKSARIEATEKQLENMAELIKQSGRDMDQREREKLMLEIEIAKLEALMENNTMLRKMFDARLAREHEELEQTLEGYALAQAWAEDFSAMGAPQPHTTNPIIILERDPRFRWEDRAPAKDNRR